MAFDGSSNFISNFSSSFSIMVSSNDWFEVIESFWVIDEWTVSLRRVALFLEISKKNEKILFIQNLNQI